jgi:hypothetical protein
MTRGQKICAFIEAYCLIPEGAQVGQPTRPRNLIRETKNQWANLGG